MFLHVAGYSKPLAATVTHMRLHPRVDLLVDIEVRLLGK